MKLKIRQHPRLEQVVIGDEIYSHLHRLYARVEAIFPAAVCVKVGLLTFHRGIDLTLMPQLWRAEDIENLSVCRHCGSRDALTRDAETGIPFRTCQHCRDSERDLPA